MIELCSLLMLDEKKVPWNEDIRCGEVVEAPKGTDTSLPVEDKNGGSGNEEYREFLDHGMVFPPGHLPQPVTEVLAEFWDQMAKQGPTLLGAYDEDI